MSKLREWLERAKLTGSTDSASFARVQAACVAIVRALDTVPGLTDAERAQALTTLSAHQTMRNVMTSGILSELGKPRPVAHQCTDDRNERCEPDHCTANGCPHARGARRERE